MARQITSTVFGGGPGFLEEWVALRDRLEWAVDLLTGLQQPDHSDSEAIARQAELNRAKDNAALRDAARDILAGLGLTAEDLIEPESEPTPDADGQTLPGRTSIWARTVRKRGVKA